MIVDCVFCREPLLDVVVGQCRFSGTITCLHCGKESEFHMGKEK